MVLIGVVALVQIPVELLREIASTMMIAMVISYVAHTTASLHSHNMQAAAMNHFQVSKELLQSLQTTNKPDFCYRSNFIGNRDKKKNSLTLGGVHNLRLQHFALF